MGIKFSDRKYGYKETEKERKEFINEMITNSKTKIINDILETEVDGCIYNIDNKGNIYYKTIDKMDYIGNLSTFGFTKKEITLLFSNKYKYIS